jgi:hypothetical protein
MDLCLFIIFKRSFSDETLLNFIKQSTQLRGKEEKRERTQVRAEDMQKPKGAQESQRGKGTNYILQPSPVAKNISKKERGEKPESAINLK